ncbi:PepSY domain-containing protein [Chitinophaga ginsengisegetis]|uniref:PepSY-associated TM helix domain-containing protein n=1 Tax=Chitinophaga ginsengisegetis TaxID=393003 RepID=UPI000DB95D9E|nr:PepSY-associated TM helix domain-containing protein [Chitinophaga ginsengisegetis]MDR6567188.1 putative iron-regulated membrane protein [Chitinophaga ginsengisegetis]MDR6646918.1 putative iron-regulated membrane protein [Chitinophaga ginsengisegetis]MDR6653268.1 putative iron-regulated membrane protein [Chitinophaga ginsengisegetis]
MFKRTDKLKKKQHKSLFRIVVDKLHLWLGLGAGIIVLIISITGCLFVFQKEVNDYYYRKILYVTPENTPLRPVSELKKTAQAALGPDKPAMSITTYARPDMAWEFMAYKGNDTALTYFGTLEYYESVLVNPYTGKVTGRIDYKYNFFSIVKGIHWSLLLNDKYGQTIVGWSTLIFVVLMITGLIMWWPKKWNKANRDKSFKIKWKAGFKRVNYDLHNVLGFYAMIIALVIAFTGMVWAFTWFQTTVYVVASRSITPPDVKQYESAKTAAKLSRDPLDIAYSKALPILKDAKRIFIAPAFGETGVNTISGNKGEETYYGSDNLTFDQYSGELLGRRNDSHKNAGERLIDMNYDIHVGAIAGLPGKILAFIISLICASLPVTGFYVWWGKRKKSKKKPVVIRASAVPSTM